jgi:hypothetical protein
MRLILLVSALFAICIAQIPIPKRYDGFYQGHADAPILFEAFIDFLCPGKFFPRKKKSTKIFLKIVNKHGQILNL